MKHKPPMVSIVLGSTLLSLGMIGFALAHHFKAGQKGAHSKKQLIESNTLHARLRLYRHRMHPQGRAIPDRRPLRQSNWRVWND